MHRQEFRAGVRAQRRLKHAFRPGFSAFHNFHRLADVIGSAKLPDTENVFLPRGDDDFINPAAAIQGQQRPGQYWLSIQIIKQFVQPAHTRRHPCRRHQRRAVRMLGRFMTKQFRKYAHGAFHPSL